MNLRTTLLTLGLLAVAGQATAQEVKPFDDYCTVGAVRTCASVRVWTHWDGALTNVQIWVRNLQGSNPNDNTGGAPITRLGITNPNIRYPANLTVVAAGGAQVVGNAASYWGITNSKIEGPVTFATTVPSALTGGIMGCDAFPPNASAYFRTCGPTGGWVVFSFTTRNQWTAPISQIAWKVQTTALDGKFYACRTGDLAGDPEYCATTNLDPTVTPEPISATLMGTGLMGLAAAARRRRKKKAEEATA